MPPDEGGGMGIKMIQCRYEQIAEILENRIIEGNWKVGEKLPGEVALAKEFQVGRSTIRETLNILQEKGMLDKRHGSGTYVKSNEPKMLNPLLQLNSIGQMIEKAGYKSKSIVHGISEIVPDMKMQEKLQLVEQDRVIVLNRERTADDIPVAFSYNFFPKCFVGDYLSKQFEGSIFQFLEKKCQIHLSHADTVIKGISRKSKWDREALNYLGESIVLLEQLHYDQNYHPVMFAFDYLRTDMVSLKIKREYLD